MSANRAGRRGPLSLVLAAVLAVQVAAVPAQSVAPASGGRSTVRGDGRGLATFGDRGLTTFGDRLGESFGRRPLESFGNIPLESMGGLERPPLGGGRPDRGLDPGADRSSRRPFARRPHRFDVDDGAGRGGGAARSRSVATLRGSISAAPEETTRFVLPPLQLPPLTLDLAPAEAELVATLRSEATQLAARGDAATAAWLVAATR